SSATTSSPSSPAAPAPNRGSTSIEATTPATSTAGNCHSRCAGERAGLQNPTSDQPNPRRPSRCTRTATSPATALPANTVSATTGSPNRTTPAASSPSMPTTTTTMKPMLYSRTHANAATATRPRIGVVQRPGRPRARGWARERGLWMSRAPVCRSAQRVGHPVGGVGSGLDLLERDALHELDQGEAVGVAVEHAEFGDDPVHAAQTRERQGGLGDDL